MVLGNLHLVQLFLVLELPLQVKKLALPLFQVSNDHLKQFRFLLSFCPLSFVKEMILL